jgi:ABC-type lipoprotein release transport system permease subunit
MALGAAPSDVLRLVLRGTFALAAVALIASLGPARRAMSVQPVIALQYE